MQQFYKRSNPRQLNEHRFWCISELYKSYKCKKPNSVTRIESGTFNDCSCLTEIDIPDNLTYIGSYAFSECNSLTSITIPDSVTSIYNHAFNECAQLTSVTFINTSGWSYASTTSITSISTSDLTNVSIAAKYLTTTYKYYYWYRN